MKEKEEEFRVEFAPLKGKDHFPVLARNLVRFEEKIWNTLPRAQYELPGQALDAFHLSYSKLYRLSRREFLKKGGTFKATLLSSERSLRSTALLTNEISYTPHEDEVYWAARENPSALGALARQSTSLFHEQNHRILWHTIPVPAKPTPENVRKYFNFVESLVITLDMMCGDELGTAKSAIGYQLGVLYDPGTDRPRMPERETLNYYHFCLRLTYLLLEGVDDKKIRKWAAAEPLSLPEAARKHAIDRSLRLDPVFVEKTNPLWQKIHAKEIREFLGSFPKTRRTFNPGKNLDDWRDEYLWAEKVLGPYAKAIKF